MADSIQNESGEWEMLNPNGDWVIVSGDIDPDAPTHAQARLAGKFRKVKRPRLGGATGKASGRLRKGIVSQAGKAFLEHFIAPVAVEIIVDEIEGNLFKHPADSVKNADGSYTYKDGSIATDRQIKHPDGSVSTPDGKVAYQNGTSYDRATQVVKFADGAEVQGEYDENDKLVVTL
ncbi:hypothetical protein [Pseudomonas vlassakiae]|uniref:Uncharacterized protein n=1 Tax=Pseudomonas vlassakiae TaxID=485888 RepID=A0A923K7J7_9PSED|nr:hypothetical protein [Pseudomonas vlassakiae]MBV4542558.1 hypothetical protein [Pseudomonas vlassakiae]